jgi:hypothetical protein
MKRWLFGILQQDFNPLFVFHSGFKMSQQFTNQKAPASQNWFLGLYNALKTWVSKEIIDFDPFDDEGVLTHQLFEQLLKRQNDPEFVIASDTIKR